MTTKMQVLCAPNLFVDNEVYCLRRDAGVPDMAIAGASWIMAREPPKIARLLTLQHATALALSKLAGYSLWLFAGTKVWKPESRIARYRNWKLWGALKASDLAIPAGHDVGEYPVETNDGLHYFGALHLESDLLEPTVEILEAEPLSHLAALHPKQREAVADLIRVGWRRARQGHGPSWEVLNAVCGADGVVFWPVGAFDDVEAGAVAFANSSLIERMLRA